MEKNGNVLRMGQKASVVKSFDLILCRQAMSAEEISKVSLAKPWSDACDRAKLDGNRNMSILAVITYFGMKLC